MLSLKSTLLSRLQVARIKLFNFQKDTRNMLQLYTPTSGKDWQCDFFPSHKTSGKSRGKSHTTKIQKKKFQKEIVTKQSKKHYEAYKPPSCT